MFYHSLLSCWNHGNAHFLRGVVRELLHRGHDVRVFEARNNWSLQNLKSEHGTAPIRAFKRAYPGLSTNFYNLQTIDLDEVLADADLVIVHEWSDPQLAHRIGLHRAHAGKYLLLFHDTHHRAVTAPHEMARYDLRHYDAVLAFGNVLRDIYLQRRWTARAFTWHEAADIALFRPISGKRRQGDLVWIGNWGDNERTAELHEFLLNPIKSLKLSAKFFGVRYPDFAREALADAGITYGNWLANFKAPEVFAKYACTAHVPRRPYVQALLGIPTIRVFEALACGIPLVCSPWNDVENLFEPGKDYLVARDGNEMRKHLAALINEPELRRQLAAHGHRTILSRHTCAHRVDELLNIAAELTAEKKIGSLNHRSIGSMKKRRSPNASMIQ